MFVDLAKLLIWLWKQAVGRRKEITDDKLDEDSRTILAQALETLHARRLILLQATRPVCLGTVTEDMHGNSLLFKTTVDRFNTPLPVLAKLPRPFDVTGLFDMQDLDKTIFREFWEFPDHDSAESNSMILSAMKATGARAITIYHLQNRRKCVAGVLVVLYDNFHQFTDNDRDEIRYVAHQLHIILPWLQ